MVKLYGIPNCDTVKKTLTYFREKNIPVSFHNFKTDGISAEKLEEWFAAAGINKVVNKNSTTYKELDESAKKALENPSTAIPVIQEHTSLVKRPVVEADGKTLLGFKKDEYDKTFL
ncbi:MAG: Spx/MgsR family RNA polymerase-binding regulatory protein [Leadbetterella sp.]|nr:Spx/MgsR family RNA polymerase-binding regulatory protein [Leadbetterella sp.]